MTFDGLRPQRLVVVVGTGTEIGKTYVTARLLRDLRSKGIDVAARKPAQCSIGGSIQAAELESHRSIDQCGLIKLECTK